MIEIWYINMATNTNLKYANSSSNYYVIMSIGVVNWWVGPSARPDNQILGRVHFLRAVAVVHILKVN